MSAVMEGLVYFQERMKYPGRSIAKMTNAMFFGDIFCRVVK